MSTTRPSEEQPSSATPAQQSSSGIIVAIVVLLVFALGAGGWIWYALRDAGPAGAGNVASTDANSKASRPPNLPKGFPASYDKVVALQVNRLGMPGDPAKRRLKSVPTGMLVRELARQALLISARNELELATRDTGLREEVELVDDGPILPIVIDASVNDQLKYMLSIAGYDRNLKRVRATIPTIDLPERNWLLPLVRHLEPLSRKEFVAFLQSTGYSGKPRPPIGEAKLPEEIVEQLEQMDLLSQFAAVRSLHAIIKRDGEAPETLAALARGYANLGALTEFLWNGSNKVFKARALLYAERLVAREKRSPASLQSRAYVYALTGCHQPALDDLNESAGKGDLPAWSDAIRAYCEYEPEKLKVAGQRAENSQLVPYLRLLLNETSGDLNVLIESCMAMLNANPNCEHAVDILSEAPTLGVVRVASHKAPVQYARNLYRRLADIPALPEAAKADVARLKNAEPQNAEDLTFVQQEIPTRQRVLKALHEAGKAEADSVDPSWQVLEQLIRDVSFVQVFRILYFEQHMLGVSPDETRQQLGGLAESHPWQLFIESFTENPQERLNALQKLKERLDDTQLEFTAGYLVHALYEAQKSVHDGAVQGAINAVYDHHDEIYRDMAQHSMETKDPNLQGDLMQKLQLLAPNTPVAIRATLQMSYTVTDEQFDEWERRYGDRPEVLTALADRHALKRPDDALRCLERLAAVSPTHDAYQKIAEHKLSRGDMEGWQSALEASLKLPSLGLEKSEIQIKLADYFMSLGQWDRARPLAEAAARTGSASGFECAGRCCEGLQDWQASEAYYRAMSMRYQSISQEWYWWCCRNGRGDRDSAREVAQRGLQISNSPTGLDQNRGILGTFLILENDPAEALKVFDAARQDMASFMEGHAEELWAIQTILLAMEQDDTERRDAALEYIRKHNVHEARVNQRWTTRLEEMFSNTLKNGAQSWDQKRFDELILISPWGEATHAWWAAGRFLDLLGEQELSRKYLELAAGSPVRSLIGCTFANNALRKKGTETIPVRPQEQEESRLDLSHLVQRGLRQLKVDRNDKAISNFTRALEIDPACRPALWGRGRAFKETGDFVRALADFTQLVESTPEDLSAKKDRALLVERAAGPGAAISELESVIALDPDWREGHEQVATILAICPDESLRNPQRALDHMSEKWVTVSNSLTRAAAYSQLEKFDDAVKWTERAIAEMNLYKDDLTESVGLPRLADANRLLELYRAKKKYERAPE